MCIRDRPAGARRSVRGASCLRSVARGAFSWCDAHLVETESRTSVALPQRWGRADADGVRMDLQVSTLHRSAGIDEKWLGGVGGDKAVACLLYTSSAMVSQWWVPRRTREHLVGSKIPARRRGTALGHDNRRGVCGRDSPPVSHRLARQPAFRGDCLGWSETGSAGAAYPSPGSALELVPVLASSARCGSKPRGRLGCWRRSKAQVANDWRSSRDDRRKVTVRTASLRSSGAGHKGGELVDARHGPQSR